VAKKVLLTGFEPFGKATLNPSGEIVKEIASTNLPDYDIVTCILPVEYERASSLLLQKIAEISPDAIISLGQAEGRKEISLERIAVNIAGARIPDNAAVLKSDEPILYGGADAYFTTLPYTKIITAIKDLGIPAGESLSAGTFICNEIFYRLQQELAGSARPSGFIHVPLQSEQAKEFPGQPTMELTDMVRGICAAIQQL
jgi:pyroglutamyl-peptidase